jgi:hypothetical protein
MGFASQTAAGARLRRFNFALVDASGHSAATLAPCCRRILRSNLPHGGVRDESGCSESLKVEHSTGTPTAIVIGRVLAQKMLLEAGRYLEQADESFGP